MNGLTWNSERFKVVSGSEPVEYHNFVWPNNDKIEHDPYEWSCPCLPDYTITIGVHKGPDMHGALCICTMFEIIHHSLDGRELFE